MRQEPAQPLVLATETRGENRLDPIFFQLDFNFEGAARDYLQYPAYK